MKDGILILNKPQEWTSSDCVAICRRALGVAGIKKVGHGGTLDPMATGVLPIFVGQATRIMEYLELDYKTYICTARLGTITDTLDIWGQVIEQRPVEEYVKLELIEEILRDALSDFMGNIEQIPPKYSAVRINGKRLYEYAYSGEEIDVEVKPRKAHISHIELMNVSGIEFTFKVTCSKGTYIRTICSDLGEKLGCGCVMTALRREQVGNISLNMKMADTGAVQVPDARQVKKLIEDAGTDEEAKRQVAETLESIFLSADYPLIHFGVATMSSDRALYFSRGNAIRLKQIEIRKRPDIPVNEETGQMPCNARGRRYDCIYKIYEKETGTFLGTGFLDERAKEMKADKVFVSKR